MTKKIFAILVLISLFALFLNGYKKYEVPPSFNADEAAFGYNAYSIIKTGKDEYGSVLPLRLKSFGDYKLPLYSYLSVPFVGLMGLTEESARMLNTVLIMLFPFVMFALVRELFKKNTVAVLAALLSATSWGLQSLTRQAHEAFLAVFLTTLALYFFIRLTKKVSIRSVFFFLGSLLLSLFSYQTSRIFALYFFILSLVYFVRNRKGRVFIASCIIVIILFGVTDFVYQPKRVANLLLFNTKGFELKINELRGEGGSRLRYNKLTVGTKDFVTSYAKYFSPQFLFISGDENFRFGFVDMGPITLLEYVFIFIGIYFLFKKKERYRYIVLTLLLISPVPAALSWAGTSLTRSLFFLVPILIVAAYGMYQSYHAIPKKYSLLLVVYLIVAEFFLLFYTWDFYLNHYPKRALAQRAWQTGNRELASYVQENYENYNRFYISRKNGQPYVFLLFYMKYPPEKYQKMAQLSSPDEYGFGQVEQFDKFDFNFRIPKPGEKAVAIGYPDDFSNLNIESSKIKKIKSGTEEIFWIYEVR